jgi:hypothetical protein
VNTAWALGRLLDWLRELGSEPFLWGLIEQP